MHYLRTCLLLVVMSSIGLYAGSLVKIEKDNAVQKELELSVTHKESQQDNGKVTVTVTFKGNQQNNVNLITNGKNTELAIEVKDGMVSMSFEIEKTNLEKSSLNISRVSPHRCRSAYLLYWKEFVV